jgi:hypothetical protein
MPHGMTKVTAPLPPAATTRMPQHQQEEQSSPPSPSPCFYSSRLLKVYTPAEIEHYETSKTIVKYVEAKTIQDKNTRFISGMLSTLSPCLDYLQ